MASPTVLRIQEQSPHEDGFHATMSFDSGPPYAITVRNPFNDEQEDEPEWYFEQHLRFPFTQTVRAKHAAASLTTYGEELFKQVFQENLDVYAEYKALLKAGLNEVQLEIAGSPTFHALHWETLKDPQPPKPLPLQAILLRRNIHPPPLHVSHQPSHTIYLTISPSL